MLLGPGQINFYNFGPSKPLKQPFSNFYPGGTVEMIFRSQGTPA
jgi:hypothetical protein